MAGPWLKARIPHRSLKALERLKRERPDQLQRELTAAVVTTAAAAQAEARAHAPVFMGTLANSIQLVGPQIRLDGPRLVISESVESNQNYAIVMEEGRRPGGKMPPAEPIERWVELKARRGDLSLGERTVRSVAFVIRRKIARDGTPAHKFFAKAKTLARRILHQQVDAALERAMR